MKATHTIIINTERQLTKADLDLYLANLVQAGYPPAVIEMANKTGEAAWVEPTVQTTITIKKKRRFI